MAIILKPLKNLKTKLIKSITKLADNCTAETETEAVTKQFS